MTSSNNSGIDVNPSFTNGPEPEPDGQGKPNGADTAEGMNGADEEAPFGTASSDDRIPSAYEQLLTEVEALGPINPKALDRVLDAIHCVHNRLTGAEREALLKIAQKKSGFSVEEFKRILKSRRAEPRQDIIDDDEQAEPADGPITPYELGSEILQLFHKQVSMGQHDEVVAALWTIGTWGFEQSPIYPRLRLFSAAPDCGKTTTLDTIECAACRPVQVDSITSAALIRALDEYKPTFLLDEGDTYLQRNPDFQKVLNSGHRKRGAALLNVPGAKQGTWQVKKLRTYAPVAYASLSGVHPSTMSRSLTINLERALGFLDQLDEAGLASKRKELAPHLLAHKEAIGAALAAKIDPKLLPQGLRTRQLDNWRPMFLIAGWLDETRLSSAAFSWFDAVYGACGAALKVPRAQTDREKLLADLHGIMLEERRQAAARLREWQQKTGRGKTKETIREWFASAELDRKTQERTTRLMALKPPRILQRHRPAVESFVSEQSSSTTSTQSNGQEWAKNQLFSGSALAAKLNVMEHRPWPGYNKRARESGIASTDISKMMKPFDIVPGRHLSGVVIARMEYDNKNPPYGYLFNEVRRVALKYRP